MPESFLLSREDAQSGRSVFLKLFAVNSVYSEFSHLLALLIKEDYFPEYSNRSIHQQTIF